MTVAKDQHFLPRFYLQHFVDPDTPPGQEPYVWLFDLSERRWRKRAPKNVATLRHFYAFRDEGNRVNNPIEPILSTIESIGATLIHKLEAGTPLSLREQLRFSFFVSLLTVRTPQGREVTERFLERKGQEFIQSMIKRWREQPEEFTAAVRAYQQKNGTDMVVDLDHLEQRPPRLVPSDAGKIGYSLKPAEGLMQRLMGMTWRFYFAEERHHLVICDHPGDFALPPTVTKESFRGFLTQGAEFHLPLTPHLVFAAHDAGFDRGFSGALTAQDVARVNRRMALRATRFIVSTKPSFVGDEVLAELAAA